MNTTMQMPVQRLDYRRPPPRRDGRPFPVVVDIPDNEDTQRRARRNHGGQSLQRLAERKGCSLAEIAAIVEDRDWCAGMTEDEAIEAIERLQAAKVDA